MKLSSCCWTLDAGIASTGDWTLFLGNTFQLIRIYYMNQNKTIMYNINHSRSKFKLGTEIEVAQCSGVDSGKKGKVINHFNWREESGAYSPPSNEHVPIKYENGNVSYMHRNRLIIK